MEEVGSGNVVIVVVVCCCPVVSGEVECCDAVGVVVDSFSSVVLLEIVREGGVGNGGQVVLVLSV